MHGSQRGISQKGSIHEEDQASVLGLHKRAYIQILGGLEALLDSEYS